MPYISALSALSRRSETCDSSSASVSSRGIKPLRSLRSLRETYSHHRMFCFCTFLVFRSYLRICHKNIIFAFRNYKLGRL